MANKRRIPRQPNLGRAKVKITLDQLRAIADFCGQEYRKSYGCLGEYYNCDSGLCLPSYQFRNEGYHRERDWVCRSICKKIADQLPEGFSGKDLE